MCWGDIWHCYGSLVLGCAGIATVLGCAGIAMVLGSAGIAMVLGSAGVMYGIAMVLGVCWGDIWHCYGSRGVLG